MADRTALAAAKRPFDGWNIYKIASKGVWLGEVVGAPDEAAAMEKAGAEFKVPGKHLPERLLWSKPLRAACRRLIGWFNRGTISRGQSIGWFNRGTISYSKSRA
jgi:hypothetical protein